MVLKLNPRSTRLKTRITMCVAMGIWCVTSQHPALRTHCRRYSTTWKRCDWANKRRAALLFECPDFSEGWPQLMQMCMDCTVKSGNDMQRFQETLVQGQARFQEARRSGLGPYPVMSESLDAETSSPEFNAEIMVHAPSSEFFKWWDDWTEWEAKSRANELQYYADQFRPMRIQRLEVQRKTGSRGRQHSEDEDMPAPTKGITKGRTLVPVPRTLS